MVIAGGVWVAAPTGAPLAGFNGAGDGDRRRVAFVVRAEHLLGLASTEPAMVIAGGGERRVRRVAAHDELQRSRRW